MEDRAVLTDLFDAANRHDLEAVVVLVDPDFVGEVPSTMSPEPDFYRGHDGIRRYFESFWDIVDELKFVVGEIEDAGDGWSLISARSQGIGRGSGVAIDGGVVMAAQLRDGKLLRLRAHPDADAAREWLSGERS